MVETVGPDSVVVGLGSGGDPFCRGGGDAGAFVVDRFGRFVGMVWGGNDCMGVSYVMQAGDLFEDIRRRTGAVEVRLPTYFGSL